MKYYIYDLYKNRYVKEFENMDEMIQFLGRNTYLNQDWWSNRSESATKLNQKYKNAYLDEINMNFNDMYLGGICGEYYTRRYMFIDDNWKIYDMRVYWEEIKKEYCRLKDSYSKNKKKENDFCYGDLISSVSWKKAYLYRYRIDPVPHTGHSHGYHFFRHPHTTAEKRSICDEDIYMHTRPKRRHLPSVYDDIYRHNEKSWKKQKIKKQWMKHEKKQDR